MKTVNADTLAAAVGDEAIQHEMEVAYLDPEMAAALILERIPPDPRLASDAAVLGAHLAGGCVIPNMSREDLERYLGAYRDTLLRSKADPRLDALLAAGRRVQQHHDTICKGCSWCINDEMLSDALAAFDQ